MVPTSLITKLLHATAALNLLAGLASVALPDLHARLMLAPGTVLDGITLRYHVLLWLFVAAMAVGYAIAARDPERYTALIVAGGVGKLLAVVVWVEVLLSGLGGVLLWAAVAFDGTLAIVFLVYIATGSGRRA